MTTDRVTCAIHQPNLFPRPSTLHKIAAADIWIVLDDVQFNRRDYQHRARLAGLTDDTQQQWLSLPVQRPSGRRSLINEVLLLNQETSARRVVKLTEQYYRRAPHWELVRDITAEVAAVIRGASHLTTATELSTRLLLETLGWHGATVHSSTLPARTGRSSRLADLAKHVGATEYLCGPGGARYLDEHPFTDHGIPIRYVQEGRHDATGSALHAVSAVRQLALNGKPTDFY